MTTFHKLQRVLTSLALSAVALSSAWGQQDTSGQSSGAPPAATTTAAQNLENPPLSGLDVPVSEPIFGGRSFLIPGLQLSEAVDSNGFGSSNSGNQTITGISSGLGSVALQKIWRRYQFGADYVAGGSYYTGPIPANTSRGYQTHSLGADQRILWRTGDLSIRDTFTYLPEGTFGFNSYGGFGAFSGALGGSGISGVGVGSGLGGGITGGITGGIYGGGQYGTIGVQPRVDNVVIVDVAQGLSPRSTVTLGAGYDFNEFLATHRSAFPLVNSQMATGQIGYNHLLSRRSQIAFTAAYQQIDFPGGNGGGIHDSVFQGMYGHRISGRLDLVLSGGPQIVTVNTAFVSTAGGHIVAIPASTSVSGAGSVSLGYNWTNRTDLHFDYQHYVTAGSGFYTGANTDAVRGTLSHILSRNWTMMTDVGWSYDTPLQTRLTTRGINSRSYEYWYAGGTLRRLLGKNFDVFATYQYDAFLAGSCSSANGSRAVCGQNFNRHTGVIGMDWHPRPIRLD